MKKVFLLLVVLVFVSAVFFVKRPYRHKSQVVSIEQESESEPKSLIRIIGQPEPQDGVEDVSSEMIIDGETSTVDYSVLSFYRIKGISFMEESPFAMIEDVRSGLANKYTIGDDIEGWQLVSIDRKEVVLENQGLVVGLMFELNVRGGIIKTSDNEWSLTEKMVIDSAVNFDRVINDLLENNVISFDFLDSKDEEGVTIKKIGQNSILQETGFEEGDKIVSVNGNDIKGFEVLVAVANDALLKGSQSVELEVVRRGTVEKLRFNLPSISKKAIAAGILSNIFPAANNIQGQ